MTTEETLKEILYEYERAGLIELDPVKVLSFLSEDVIGIGMGEQGIVSSKQEISDIMLEGIKEDANAEYFLDIKNVEVRVTTDSTASLCAGVYVKRVCKEIESISGFMQSLSFVLRNGKWQICCLHASPIMLSEEAIESYPLSFADRTLTKLKAEIQQDTFELMNRKFSGGIMGIYTQKPYNLYFVNDKLLSMLGYERTEFEQDYGMQVQLVFQLERSEIDSLKAKILSGEDFSIRSKWKKKDGTEIWVELCARRSEDEMGKTVLISIVTDITEIVTLQMEAEKQTKTILSSLRYASKIQRNLLPKEQIFKQVFSDYSICWEPKDIVGGDVYWLKTFEKGSVLAVGDCTGHSIPGALLTMLVVSALDNIVTEENCSDTAEILHQLDQNMAGVLNGYEQSQSQRITDIKDGCDIAVCYIGKNKEILISASNMYMFVCDGIEVKRIRGQRFYIGEGILEDKKMIKTQTIPTDNHPHIFIASDGLFDQIGGEKELPFGTGSVKEIILKNYNCSQKDISDKIWKAFEHYQGNHIRRDDVEIISFVP